MKRRLICYHWNNPIMGYTENNLVMGSLINILGNCYIVVMKSSYSDGTFYKGEEYRIEYIGSSNSRDNLIDVIIEQELA